MPTGSTPRSGLHTIPVWVLVVAPLLSIGLSNADVLLLAWQTPLSEAATLRFAIATTVPLSVISCGVTLWLLLRLRREVVLRSDAERETRAALADLKRVLDRERLLRGELDHRVRNNLSALLGLVAIYEDSDFSRDDVVSAMRGKIMTLREAYTLLAASPGEGVSLADLLRTIAAAVIGHTTANQIRLNGPGVRLTGREANAFAMITQELLTNATKHGALRSPEGQIQITWSITPTPSGDSLSMQWCERLDAATEVYPSSNGKSPGMGLTLVESIAASDLRGGIRYMQAGNQWHVELSARLTSGTPRPATDARSGNPTLQETCT